MGVSGPVGPWDQPSHIFVWLGNLVPWSPLPTPFQPSPLPPNLSLTPTPLGGQLSPSSPPSDRAVDLPYPYPLSAPPF